MKISCLQTTLAIIVSSGICSAANGPQHCFKQFVNNRWEIHGNCENREKLDRVFADIRRQVKKESPHSSNAPKLLPQSCHDVLLVTAKSLNDTGGVFDINITGIGDSPTEVFCDMKTDGGNWTVFQRRMDGSVDFYRNWNDYVDGFGFVNGEFWLGLEVIHQLTKYGDQELRIDMKESNTGNQYYAQYSFFEIGPSSENYRLNVGGYSGDATDSLTNTGNPTTNHVNQPFTTKDKDNDKSSGNCALAYSGAWWYNDCFDSNLNGVYGGSEGGAVIWSNHQVSSHMFMKFTEMKIRRKM